MGMDGVIVRGVFIVAVLRLTRIVSLVLNLCVASWTVIEW